MCEFFSAVATRDGRVLFCEDDRHETTIRRARLQDTDQHIRHWVRVEVKPAGDGWGPVRVDETTVPGWWTEDQAAWEGRVLAVADRVRTARAAYLAVKQPAYAAYLAVEQPALTAYLAVQQPAYAAYLAVKQQAHAAYVSTIATITGYVKDRT